ncbi:MAG: alpha/beta-hydrolase family protein [Candidatus Nomurabacteria bacterium]|jgi:uncharacterized membrane protein|nr:alpha/beta-hydrolase family protein [Candidatus Nomurabacteria bacterium]
MTRRARIVQFYRWNFLGIVVGLILMAASLTPSLIPRGILLQSLVAAICFIVGYGAGVIISGVLRKMFRWRLPQDFKILAWRFLWTVGIVGATLYAEQVLTWQNQTRVLVGMPILTQLEFLQFAVLALIFSSALLALTRLARLGVDLMEKLVGKILPRRIGRPIGIVLGLAALIFIMRATALNLALPVADWLYRNNINNGTPPGLVKPTDNPLRSGGKNSLVSWNSLGRQGRRFIGSPIDAAQISRITGQKAMEPIRVYIGVETSRDPAVQAKLAVQELQRTGAFNRKVLLITTPTGTGWIEPQWADAFDYVYGGDDANVAIQYSYLPSWISFLVDKDRAAAAGRDLFDAVYNVWKTLPADARPKLLVDGLSLGSYGAQDAFGSLDDLTSRVDGALFAGTPNATRLWRQIESARQSGSPEWQPKLTNQNVKFGAGAADLNQNSAGWKFPRIAYLQHGSDSVVWWDWNILWQKPAWLKEPRGRDVNPNIRWYPIVSFVQNTIDLATAATPPSGHGHNYENDIARDWDAVMPSGLSAAQLDQIQKVIDTYPIKEAG